jgi:hypothetical protein
MYMILSSIYSIIQRRGQGTSEKRVQRVGERPIYIHIQIAIVPMGPLFEKIFKKQKGLIWQVRESVISVRS